LLSAGKGEQLFILISLTASKLKELGWEKAVYLRSSSNRKELEGIF
jgi:hypothetical protein